VNGDPAPHPSYLKPWYAVAARLARALALTPPCVRSPTYQDFVAADREQAASSEQVSALDLTLAGVVIGFTNSEYNPSASPTFTEWDRVKAAVDPSVDRPRPKAPELVSVDQLLWYPIQPICVREWLLDHWEHRDLEKQVERPFSSLTGPRPRSNGGQDTHDVQHTMCLLYALLTGESLSAEEEMMLSLHGLPAKYIAFAVNQLITGKDSWTEYHHCGLSERTFLCLLRNLQRLAHSSPATLFPTNTSNRFRPDPNNIARILQYF